MLTKRIIFLFLSVVSLCCQAQSLYRVQCYDELTTNILDMGRMAQDAKGFLWISTSDGLYRFDGYEFKAFRSRTEDGLSINSDNIERLVKDDHGNLWCQVDNKALIFDTKTYVFRNTLAELEKSTGKTFVVRKVHTMPNGTTWVLCDNGIFINILNQSPLSSARVALQVKGEADEIDSDSKNVWLKSSVGNYLYRNGKATMTNTVPERTHHHTPFYTDRFGHAWEREEIDAPGINEMKSKFFDNQDNVWYISGRHLYRISFYAQMFSNIATETMPNRFCFRDRLGRTWINARKDKLITIYAKDNSLIGYLTPKGTISKTPTEFDASPYAIFQDKRGTIWLGTKPDGLYRIKPQADGTFAITHYSEANGLIDNEVVDVTEDYQGRIWIAGFKKGLSCITQPQSEQIQFTKIGNAAQRLTPNEIKCRNIIITKDNVLLAATSAGLITLDISKPLSQLAKGAGVKLHQRELNRPTSLNCTALKHIFQASDGRIYICTRDGGINLLITKNLLADRLDFKHFDSEHGFPTDYVRSMCEYNGTLWVTALNKLIEWHPDKQMPEGACVRLSLDDNDFTETAPSRRSDGKWLFGVQNGVIVLNLNDLVAKQEGAKRNPDGSDKAKQAFPPIVLTSAVDNDTITLASDERTLTLSFAALDYNDPKQISYAVKFIHDGEGKWQYLGHTHEISFQHLSPGKYTLILRSTDSRGEWMNNDRSIVIIVTPTVWETWWMKLLYFLVVCGIVVGGYFTWRYIKRMQKQQRETLDAYMQLMNHTEQQQRKQAEQEQYRKELLIKARVEPQNDEFIKKIMSFIDEHISDPNMDIDKMAQESAVSRSQLNHKLKQILGVTPSEMIREARIKRACLLLQDDSKSINDIAYSCGFTDPKYFSKCFKQSVGDTPTNYRLKI